jgi:hypothetical protein
VGVTALEVVENRLTPLAFHARTRNRYVVPLVRLGIVWLVAVDMKYRGPWVAIPMYGVTTYPTMGEPLSVAGGVHVTVADCVPAVAVPMVGAVGVPAVIGFVTLEKAPSPISLTAWTRKRYSTPLVSPDMIWEVLVAPKSIWLFTG